MNGLTQQEVDAHGGGPSGAVVPGETQPEEDATSEENPEDFVHGWTQHSLDEMGEEPSNGGARGLSRQEGDAKNGFVQWRGPAAGAEKMGEE